MMSHRFFSSLLLTAVLVFTALPARADHDAVHFFNNINVPPGSSVHDAVCFFCNVNVEGTADHDIVVFFGDVHIASHANHDVVNFFGSVRADDNASITHDLVNFFGTVQLGDHVTVGNDMVAMFSDLRAPDSVSVAGNTVLQPAWLLWIPFTIIAGIVIFIVQLVRTHRRRQLMAYYYPHPPYPPSQSQL